MAKKFSEEDKLKCLLWSDRHCCVCDTPCGLDIEIAHIDPKGGEDFDNAIPVCYKHHAEIGRYNKEHPVATNTESKNLNNVESKSTRSTLDISFRRFFST